MAGKLKIEREAKAFSNFYAHINKQLRGPEYSGMENTIFPGKYIKGLSW